LEEKGRRERDGSDGKSVEEREYSTRKERERKGSGKGSGAEREKKRRKRSGERENSNTPLNLVRKELKNIFP
jgi:hypothetical protein